jgi:sugar O-acyltransferase (sialic acid O-acetyltransferase NeuD family)
VITAVYGASGFGREVMPLVRAREIVLNSVSPCCSPRCIFIDDGVLSGSVARVVNGQDVVSYDEFLGIEAAEKRVVIAIADVDTRKKLSERCKKNGIDFFQVCARNSIIMDDVIVGNGSIISAFSTITSNVRIGDHFHCNLYGYVAHDCVIGDFVTFAPGVHCNGNVVIEDHSYIGTGALIKNGEPGNPLVVGKGAVIGMGAVVTRSVPPGATVVGNPARVLRQRSVPTC